MNSSVFFKISKQFLFTSLDSAVLLFGSLKLSSKESKKSRTLLIRIDNIGDFILWIPTAKKTKEIYSEEYLILIVQKSVQDLAKLLPYWDEVIAIDEHRLRNNFTYRWKTLWQIKTLGAKVGIEFAFSRSILAGDSIIRWSGAQKRIGSSGNLSNIPKVSKRISNSWYTELISADSAELHELERNAEFIQNLTQQNIPVQLPQLPQLVDAPPPAEKFVVLFPGASLIEKQWPTKNFAVCAD
jgi:ADP-heptose:LPS heptosyltransferase